MPNILDLIPGLSGPPITVISGLRGLRGNARRGIGAPPASPIPIVPGAVVSAAVSLTNSGQLLLGCAIRLDLKPSQGTSWSESTGEAVGVELQPGERKTVTAMRTVPTNWGNGQGVWAKIMVLVGTSWYTLEDTGTMPGASGYVWLIASADATWLTDITVQYGVV